MDLGLGADVDAAGRLVDDQQRRAGGRATWPARPSAGCRRTAWTPGRQPAVLELQPDGPVRRERPLGRGAGSGRPGASRASEASATFCCTDMSMTRPCCRRSSGTKPMPAAIAAVGDARRSSLAAHHDPARVVAVDPEDGPGHLAAPDPTSPASATISPARTSNEMSVNTPSRVRCSTREHELAGRAALARRPAPPARRPDHRADQVVGGQPGRARWSARAGRRA